MTKWNKRIYRGLILTSFIGVMVLCIFGIGQVLSYLNTGADRSSMLHISSNRENKYTPKVIWKDTTNPGRKIEKQTLREIQRDYLNAWYVRQEAYRNNSTLGIGDYYTSSTKTHLETIIAANKQKGILIDGTTITHQLSLDFYSTDGQLAVLSDHGVKEYQRVYKAKELISERTLQSDYKVLLLLEDGYWRIRHLVKEKSISNNVAKKVSSVDEVIDNKIYINENTFLIKGINYYPQQTPWDMFGSNFNAKVIAADMEIIKNTGLNTIRIFVPYVDFGKDKVVPQKLEKLKKVLDIAEQKDLKVIVTLFDFYGNYDVSDWTLTHRHLEQIVTSFKDHNAILAWDLKNEPNLDFDSRGKENVLAWLQEISTQLRVFDPNHLVTIGWSDMESAELLLEHVDMVSFHYYKEVSDFGTQYATLRSKITKPLVLQEYGLSSNRSLWSPFGASEKTQAKYHQEFKELITSKNVHNISWTLYDFENIPDKVAGRLFWKKNKQKYFGFINTKGERKAAFEFIGK